MALVRLACGLNTREVVSVLGIGYALSVTLDI
jgi:hypothetical protein